MAKNKLGIIALDPDKLAGHFHVEVSIEPTLPQDDMVKAQLAQAFRSPGPDGKPLMSTADILEHVVKVSNPDAVKRRVEQEWLETQDPEVVQLRAAAAKADWKDRNKELVRKAEKELYPDEDAEFKRMLKGMTPDKFKQLIAAAAQMEHMKQMGGDPSAMMQQAEMASAMQQTQQDATGRLPATVMPFQEAAPGAEVMPPQMAMDGTEQPVTADPMMLADQMRRSANPPR